MNHRLKTVISAFLALGLIFGSLFIFKKSPSAASYSYYESLKIDPASLNGNSIWGGGETFDTIVSAGGLDDWAAFYSTTNKSSGGLDPSGSLSVDGVPYNLSWTGASDYTGNDTIRLYSGHTSARISLDTIGAYEKLYVLGTAGGPGEGNYANFAVRVNYTDGTVDETDYHLYDWYDATAVEGVYKYPSLARRVIVKSSSSSSGRPNSSSSSSDYAYEGSTSAAPYLQSATISVNPKKLVSSVDLVLTGRNDSTSIDGIFCGIYAVTGMVNVSAPTPVEVIYVDNVEETTAEIYWEAVPRATSYRLDIALDPDFKNILPNYNNRLVNDVNLLAEGLTGDTLYYTRVRAENSEGQSISSNVVSFRTDPETIPPVVSLDGNPNLIQISDDLTISATDASGVRDIEESLDDGATWNKLVDGDLAHETITENGTYCYRATDNYNNTSEKTCITYSSLDTSKPVIRVNTNGYPEGSWTNQPITLTVESLSTNVGETRYFYSEDGTTWLDYDTSVVFNGETSLDGKKFYFKAISAAGVESDVVDVLLRKDNTAPEGTISSEENSWNEFLNQITFGLFFNKTVAFDIEASDALSGVSSIEYLVSDSGFSTKEAALAAEGWTLATEPVSIDPEKDFLVYYKLTDVAGNVAVINSDGVVLDTTKALILGYVDADHTYPLEPNTTYYLTQQVLVTDNKALASVKVNGESVSLSSNNLLELAGNSEHTYLIEATDKAGNVTVVTVKTGALSELDLGITEDNYRTDDKPALETVQEKLAEIEAAEGSHATTTEREILDDLEANAETVIEKINNLEAEIADEERRGAETPDIDHVTSTDRENILGIIEDIKTTLEEDGIHLTVDELNDLLTEKRELEEKLNRLDEVAEKENDLEIVNQTDVEIIKTEDKAELEELLNEANDLLSGDNLTSDERTTVEEEKVKIEELLAQISDAIAAENTSDIHDIDGKIPTGYTRDDKTDLEEALEDLEKAKEDFTNNYTDAENSAIDEKIEAIRDALDDIARQEEEEIRATTFPTLSVAAETERWLVSDLAGVTASDAYGISELAVSKDGGVTWETYDQMTTADVRITENGTYIFRATNLFDNSVTKTVVYHNLDPVKPVVEIDSHGYALGSWTNSPVLLSARNVAENLSPVSLFYREAGTETWNPYTSSLHISEDTSSKVFEFKAVSAAGLGSDVVSAEVKKDSVNPSGSLGFEEDSWTAFLNQVTFGLFFNETKKYTLSAADDRSGVDTVEYLLSTEALSESDLLASSDWQLASDAVSVDPEKDLLIYYRITDLASNRTILGMDGISFSVPRPDAASVTSSTTSSESGKETLTLVTSSGEIAIANDLEHKTINDLETLESTEEKLEALLDQTNDPLVSELLDEYRDAIAEIEAVEEKISVIEEDNATIPDLDHVTSDDRDAVEALIAAIETVEAEDANRLTPEEKTELDELLDSLYEKLALLEEVKESIDDVTDGVNGYDESTVKKDDLDALEALSDAIDELLADDNVSSEEKADLEELKEKIADLEERIAAAEEAIHNATENDHATNVTPSNVTPEDQTSLEDASAGYAEALGVFDGNLSLKDLLDVTNRVTIINNALDVLDQVAEFENLISRLPNPDDVAFSYRSAIKAAEAAYNNLSEYGRTLVGPSLMAKYRAVLDAYRALLEGSPLLYAFETLDVFWWGLSTFFIVGVFLTVTRHTHKRYVEDEADDDF
ncbi:hypothetical protein IJI72_00390 [Candidatus Saccharibacteria bacterium]|nr:hypothetical protein [Candidatus Saccharibacteria bacterium]